MDLTIREAATLTGLHPRTVRRLVATGKIPGVKRSGAWFVRSADLQPSPAEQRARAERVEMVRGAVDRSLARATGPGVISGLAAFGHVHAALALVPPEHRAHGPLRAALAHVAAGAAAFDAREKRLWWRRARRCLAVAFARLAEGVDLRDTAPRPAAEQIEREALPALGGLLRRVDRLAVRLP